MLDSTYLRDAARLVQSPLSVKAMPDGSFEITQKIAETARTIYKQVRRNYLVMFPRDMDEGKVNEAVH